jgi:hypothetical protein
MLISQNDQYFPSLVIKNGKDYISLSRFGYPQTSLKCQAMKIGRYELKFNAPSDCSSSLIGSKSNYCYTNTSIKFDVNESMLGIDENGGNKTGLWVILGILLVIILSIVIVVVCCKVSCFKKGDKVAYHIQPQTGKEGEEIEVEVVHNKL